MNDDVPKRDNVNNNSATKTTISNNETIDESEKDTQINKTTTNESSTEMSTRVYINDESVTNITNNDTIANITTSTNENPQKPENTTEDETMLNETATKAHNETSIANVLTKSNKTRRKKGQALATDNLDDNTNRNITTQNDISIAKQMVGNETESQGKYNIQMSFFKMFHYLLTIKCFVCHSYRKQCGR